MLEDVDEEIDPGELNEQLVSEALQRSAESAAEDDQIREAIVRSTESATEGDQNGDDFRFNAPVGINETTTSEENPTQGVFSFGAGLL